MNLVRKLEVRKAAEKTVIIELIQDVIVAFCFVIIGYAAAILTLAI